MSVCSLSLNAPKTLYILPNEVNAVQLVKALGHLMLPMDVSPASQNNMLDGSNQKASRDCFVAVTDKIKHAFGKDMPKYMKR